MIQTIWARGTHRNTCSMIDNSTSKANLETDERLGPWLIYLGSGKGKRMADDPEQNLPEQRPQAAWLCLPCGADFRQWVDLPPEERMTFLIRYRQFHIARLLEDDCPRCNQPFTVSAAQAASSQGGMVALH